MKTLRVFVGCGLCCVLLTSGCAFRVLEPAGEMSPAASPQQASPATPTPTSTLDQPVSAAQAGSGSTEATTTPEATAGAPQQATPSGQAEGAGAEQSQVFIPAFGQYEAQAGCRQIVLNSSMEEDAAWRFVGGKPARYDLNAAHSGARSILAGLDAGRPYHIYSDVRQWLNIPPKAITATLRLWWYPRTEEQASRLIERCTRGNCPTGDLSAGPLPAAHDLQYVLAVRPDWSFEWLLRAKANATQWQPLEFDLTRYAGRTIAVQLGVYNDSRGGLTSMSVDDVEVWVCEP